MRSSKNFSSTSTRSGESTRTLILDLELKKPVPMQPLAMVFDLDEFAVGGRLGDAEDFAVINPRMAGHDAVGLARF